MKLLKNKKLLILAGAVVALSILAGSFWLTQMHAGDKQSEQNKTKTTTKKPSTKKTATTKKTTAKKPTTKTTTKTSSSGGRSSGGSTGWPNASNTGVPAGTVLATYHGTCNINKDGTVISAKIVHCDLGISASNVVIKNSKIYGEINGGESTGSSFTLKDSEVINGARDSCGCVGSDHFTVLRTEIVGGYRGVYCRFHCTVQDSWIHGTNLLALQHASAVRVEQYSTLIHNKLQCDWTDISDSEIGCSADMTGYPDFAPIKHNLIQNNIFMANPVGIGYCAYGGGTATKPFSNDPTNATYVRFIDNVWQRGSSKKCGAYGPVTDFLSGRTGNQWTGNKWDDGTTVPPG